MFSIRYCFFVLIFCILRVINCFIIFVFVFVDVNVYWLFEFGVGVVCVFVRVC